MARIRTIKPDFWTDETLGDCSPTARLLFIGTWNIADDYGNLERSSKQLKAQLFPYDGIDCESLVQELIRAGVLVEYSAGGKNYLHIKGFDRHQKVEKKSAPRHPVFENSEPTPQPLPDQSPTSSGSSLGREGKRKGKEEASFDAAVVPGLDLELWARWIAYRQASKKPLKPQSLQAAAEEMAALGSEQAAAVRHSIANGYTGLYLPKHSGHQKPPAPAPKPPPTEEQIAEARADAQRKMQAQLARIMPRLTA